jgi:hypothetical protein
MAAEASLMNEEQANHDHAVFQLVLLTWLLHSSRRM